MNRDMCFMAIRQGRDSSRVVEYLKRQFEALESTNEVLYEEIHQHRKRLAECYAEQKRLEFTLSDITDQRDAAIGLLEECQNEILEVGERR